MSILRAAALVAVVVFCAGFIPVGGCAKGCGAAGRVASHNADDIARIGVRSGAGMSDDLARSGSRLGRYGAAGEGLGATGAHYADDLAVGGSRYADDVAVGGTHVADDVAHAADDVRLTGVGDELEQSGLKLSENQHDEVMDALQDVAEEVIGQLADADDADDEAQVKRAAVDLEARLQKTLTPQQLRRFHARYGSSEDVAYRLAREQRLKRAAGSGQK